MAPMTGRSRQGSVGAQIASTATDNGNKQTAAPRPGGEATDPVVARYLREHPHLRPILRKAHTVVDRHFGPETPIVLEVVTDPDEGDQALFAFIQTDLDPDLALERLRHLDEEWWLAVIPESRGNLQIDVRYG